MFGSKEETIPYEGDKWEYRWEHVVVEKNFAVKDQASKMNRWGAEGWELVNFMTPKADQKLQIAVLKRKVIA